MGDTTQGHDVLTGAAPFDAFAHLATSGIRPDEAVGVDALLEQLEVEVGAWWSQVDEAGDVVMGLDPVQA